MGFSLQMSLQAKKYCVAGNNHDQGAELACPKTSGNFYPAIPHKMAHDAASLQQTSSECSV
jgi:hypothetical protein